MCVKKLSRYKRLCVWIEKTFIAKEKPNWEETSLLTKHTDAMKDVEINNFGRFCK